MSLKIDRKPCSHPIGGHLNHAETRHALDQASEPDSGQMPRVKTINVIVTKCGLCSSTISERLA